MYITILPECWYVLKSNGLACLPGDCAYNEHVDTAQQMQKVPSAHLHSYVVLLNFAEQKKMQLYVAKNHLPKENQ